MKMRFLSLILVITMLASIVPTVSLASNSQGKQNVQSDGAYVPTSESAELSSADAEVAESWGMLGDNIMWEIEGATLYIDGAGDMPDYEFGNVSPWIYNEETFPYEFHNVVIGDEITSIDDTVFYLCDNIVEITIGKSVERIEDGAFAFCEMLQSIVVSEENPAYMSDENGILFNKLGNTLVQYPNELILDSFNRDYEIPDGVGTVGPYAFRGSNLKTVTFSDTVCEIGHDAFEGCTSLTDIEIPDSLTVIEDRVFCGCSSLQEIVIPDGVEEIRSQAFAAMRLYEITIPASVKVIEADAFDSSCDENTNVYYGGSESDWNNIQIVSGGNEMLLDVAVKHFAKTDSEDEVPDVVAGVLTEGECGDDLTWTLSADGTLNIDGTGDMELWSSDVYTPWHESKDSISTVVLSDGVTNIGAYAFENCTNLTDIEIPDGVSSIGDSAFSGCTSLASVAIPEGVEDIGLCAFSGCKSLGSVNIPSTVSLIYDRAFYGCSSLSKITVSAENEFFSSDENGVLFNKIKSTLICCPGGTAMTAYEIPDGVTQLDTQAFSGCASLTDVIIPEGVTDLPKGLFEDCVSLSSVTVPSTVKAIDDECFGGCDSLSQIYYCGTEEEWNEVSVSDTNEALGDVSIEYEIPMVASGACGDGLSWTLDTVGMLTISGSGAMTEWSASSALPWFDYSADIKNIVIEDGVTTVGSYAFCGLSSLRSISIPDSVTKIGNSTFNGCILLKSVYIPKNVATIGWSAFYGCASLKTVTLYDTITTIGASAFNKCSVLSDIYYYGNAEQWAAVTVNSNNVPLTAAAKHYIVPEANGTMGSNLTWKLSSDGTLTVSGTGAMTALSAAASAPWYSLRSSITRVVVEEGVTNVGNYAFCGYPYLTDVVLADTVTAIGNSSFNGDTAIKSISFPSDVKSIGWSAFYNCTSLVSVTLANKLTSVGSGAFNKCSGLKYVNYYGTSDDWSGITIAANNTYFTGATRNYVSGGAVNKAGVCGTNLTWSLDENMTLTVSGSGAMTSWSAAAATPWYDLRNRVKNIIIEDGITSIGSYAFCGFAALVSISIPDSVTNIGNSTFNGCTSLLSIEIPSSVTSIGWSVFYGCTSLESVTMSNGIASIGASAFYKCNSLKEVYYSGTEEQWNSITIGTNNDVLNANTTKHFGNILGSGECGENLMWELAKYGDLTISGTGKMYDWNSSESVPWADFSEKITKVTIGEGVTNIGNYAFSNCTNVKSVSIPDTAVSIGTYALSWCESISVVTIPSSVEYIGAKAFTGCASLKKITVESGNTAFVTDGYGVLYNITKDTLICYPAGNTAASYEIPGGTKTIISNAFYGCNILNMIIIPESVTTIEDNAFEYCECISDVYYSGTEEQWNEIDLGLGNEPITGATVHYMYVENVIDSGECGEGLTWELIDAGILIVSGSGNMESWTEENKAPWAKYSSDIKKIIVEDGVASIGSYAFEGLENITDIRLPDSVSSIGSYAFGSCSSLQTVTLGMSVSDISDYAFYGCDSLADVYYASTEEMWSKVTVGTGNDDFNNASFHFSFVDNTVDSGVCGENLTWKVDDEGLLTVSGNGTMTSWTAASETPWYAHYSTVNRVVIEEGVENIGAYAFCNFTSLKSVDIADSVAIIENSAFNGCIKLDEVVVPMGVTSIGWSAFYNCNTMYKVTFYDNLASIGASAFYKCSLLSDVYYHGNGKQWENIQVDSGNTQLSNAVKHFIVPEAEGECGENLTWKLSADGTLTVSGTGDMASWSASSATPWFEHQSGITKIVIEDGVTSVGEYAFSGLAYLTDVIIADSVTVIGHYAFSGAPLLQSVVLPDELVTLGWLSFYGCSALSHVTFGSKISSVGSSAFNSCSSLKYVYYYGTADGWSKVSVGNNNSYLINATKYYTSNGTTGESGVCGDALSWSVDDNATLTVSGSGAMTSWTAAAETPWYGLRNIINKIVIESGVTNIGDYAFCGFKAMKEADIADTVKTVGNSSFNTCTALETVSLPDGVTSIGWSAYYACYGIESLVLPASITKIGASAFYNCKNLKDVYYAGDQQQWNEIVIGVDNDVLTMETNKHFGNILYSGTYGDNLTWQIDKFGTLAISGSGEVPATDVSGDLPWIKYNTVVSKISINDGITSIGAYAFRDMLVSEISIPSSVTYIAPGAFEQISALAAIYVDAANNAYSLDESGVLYNSDKTSVIKYPSKLIGTEYIIADTAAVIESYAFSDCDSLAKLVIPASVTTISDNAIVGCDNLAEVHYSASKSAWKNVEIGEGNDSLYDAQKFFANPSGECGENLTWELDGGELTISGTGDMTQWAHESERPWHEYSEEITKVVVLEGVTSVGSFAFKALANMNTVEIASTVAVIGAAAFAECGNLEEITIPNGVETIDDGAFFASGISEFAIPASVTYIGEGAFENCQNLTSIIVDSDNMSYSSDEYGVLFDKDMATLVYCPLNAAITTYSIPDTVFAINSKAFAGNENIISITIPDGVNALESMTFMNCNNLEEITIPMSLTHISSQAFEGCASLYTVYCGHTEKAWASVVIEDGNESFVDAQKFFANPSGECGENLTWELDGGDLTISGTGDMTQWAHESERPWHEYSEEITKVVVLEGVTSVGSFAFKALANMNTVDIASTVAVIGAAAFAECGNLEEITIPNGVETIDDGAFFASGISEFAIPASVTYIGEGAFENCQNLTSIIVDSENMSYSSDEYGVLFDKDMATLVYCPLNAAITTYSIPDTVFAINSKAFAGNENIISITIPGGVNALESMTFMNCNNLEEITIPKSLTHISSQAFEGCASLYTVYCGHTEKAWASVVIEDGNESFVDAHKFFTNPSGECGENLTWELDGGVLTISGMGEMTSWSSAYETPWNEYMSEIYSVEISDGVTSIGEFAFAELINLSDVSIPSSVSYIGMNAFEMDLSLMQITIPDGVSTIESFAFSDTGISEITLPASVEMLGDGVFYRCDSLVAINVDESNEFFASDEYGVLYDKYYTELICCPSGTQMTEYSVNENVSFMRNFAFANCSSLETVEIQENDAGVSEISMGLFMDCTSLKTVYIPGYVMIIGDDAFGGCESLADIYYGNTEEVWYNNVSVGGGNDFSNVTFHFEDPVIDSGVCGDNLEWVLNNDNVLIISGYGDMYSWSYDAPWAEYAPTIRTVIFDGEITSIGDTAFAGFAVMPDIILPETLVTIGNEAFLECESLPMIMIPDSVTSIGEFAFKGCNSLSRIDVSENNTTYSSDEYGVLYSADKSKLIEVPAGFMESEYTVADGTKIIESYAFMNTMRVTSVILPDSVTTISESAFEGSMNLCDIIIPDTVTKIGKDAFAYTEIYDNSDNWTDGVLYIGNHLIKFNNEQNGSYTVKEGTVNISDYAFESAAISEIVLPDTVVSVGDYAFNLCDGINSVIFCGNEEKWNSVSIGEGNESLTGATIRLFYTVDSGNCGDNLTWTLDNEGLLTVSGTGDMTSWSEVTAIPWYGYRESIKTVIIEENVTGIGTSAFYGCSRMTEISLPDTLKTIGDSAFMECCSLKEITIPYGVTHIGYQAFDGCDALEAIYTDSENTMYSSDENGVLFNKEKTTLEKYPAGSKTAEYAVADGVAYISSCAFADCGNLTHISLSDSVTEIGEYAFSECGSLTTVSLGKGITDIGAHAFENCVNITGITIPDSAKTIGEGAFAGCDGMNIVNIGNGIASIGENAFDGCVNIAEVYYNGYKEQWSTVSVEAGNESLTGAVIHFARPGGVCGESLTWELAEDGTLIISGTGAMTNWSSAASLPWYEYISEITSVEIKEGVTSIGHYAFCAHNKLKSISIADSVTSIGNSSFNGCTSLKNIVIPKNVETIGWSAFYNCNQMTEVTMYNSLTSIGQSAFNKCSILETVYFYGNEAQWSAIEIGATNVPITAQAKIVYYVEDTNGKFGDNITWSLDKNGTLTLSGTGAMPVISAATEVPWYEYVSSVRKVVVESGITDIGAYVFEGHGYVSDVVIGDTVTKLGNRAFMKCTSIKSVTLPASVTTLGGSVFYGCTALANITIGSGLKAVGVSSFNSCSALKYVYYYGTADSWKTITITSSNTSLTNATRTYVSSGSAGVSGTCGENLVWTFDGKETLTVSGTGAMTSWSAAAATPWYDLRNRVTKIVIENGVTTIGSYAFCAFASLKDITIPDSVTSMGNSTFNSCTALESITIPSSITSIGWSVFYNCSSLDNVTMYNSITDIGASAFYRCSNLKTVYFYGTENEWNNIVRGTNNEPLSIATLQLLGDDDGTYTLSASAYVAGGNIVIKAKTDKLITDQHLHVALYSSSSKLVDYILVPMDEAFDRVNVVFKDNSEAAYAKVFLWETLTSLAPVTQAVSVEIPR